MLDLDALVSPAPLTVPDSLWRDALRFPSAELVGTAASMFPRPALVARHLAWGDMGDGLSGEFNSFREGQWPRLTIGPGMVRFARIDLDARDRAADRAAVARAKRVLTAGSISELDPHSPRYGIDGELDLTNRGWKAGEYDPPMAFDDRDYSERDERARRALVAGWSAKSKARLIAKIASLDLAPLVQGEAPPAMVTLTLPGDWRAVCPDAETASVIWNRWANAYARKWKRPLTCIWKREFQSRGAPHWHLWMVLPTDDHAAFRAWLSASWTRSLRISDPDEHARSLAAGTGVDFAEGLRARDPKRLAVYFLKESLGGEGKSYQNRPPESWGGESVGRYWGVRGIPEAVASVDLDPRDYAHLWRAARKVREATAGSRRVRALRGANASGEVKTRALNRRVKVRAGAGFVTVNDGPAFAADLGRFAGLLAERRVSVADGRGDAS